eukprot:1788034-Amphidinium_carterae.2
MAIATMRVQSSKRILEKMDCDEQKSFLIEQRRKTQSAESTKKNRLGRERSVPTEKVSQMKRIRRVLFVGGIVLNYFTSSTTTSLTQDDNKQFSLQASLSLKLGARCDGRAARSRLRWSIAPLANPLA